MIKMMQLRRLNLISAKTSFIVAVAAILPNDANLSQKKPFVFEIPVSAKDNTTSYNYLKESSRKGGKNWRSLCAGTIY